MPPAARAAARALEASLPHANDTRSFRFLFLPPEHDPDSYVRDVGVAAFESAVAAAVPLSRQIVALAAEGADFATAEGRARFLANARPLWSALPDGMLKRQLLGEIASRAALPVDELSQAWQTTAAGRPKPVAKPGRGARRGSSPRPVMRQPADRLAWMLLLESRWWESLSAADQALLCALPGWHGDLFRFIDRTATEHGGQPWAALRERMGGEAWAAAALALVAGEDPGIEPLLEELELSMLQLRRSAGRLDAMRVLGQL